jgi:Rieske Fe-S protein
MSNEPQDTTRRGVLLGAGIIGLGGALAGCSTKAVPYGANENGQLPGAQDPAAAMAGTTTAGTNMGGSNAMNATSGPSTGGANTATGGKVLTAVKEVPVGGGKIFTAEQVVVTRPTANKVHVFSAVCTHVGCILNQVSNGAIDCPCHGSQFRITDGSLITGPANGPLPKKKFKIVNGKVVLL